MKQSHWGPKNAQHFRGRADATERGASREPERGWLKRGPRMRLFHVKQLFIFSLYTQRGCKNGLSHPVKAPCKPYLALRRREPVFQGTPANQTKLTHCLFPGSFTRVRQYILSVLSSIHISYIYIFQKLFYWQF